MRVLDLFCGRWGWGREFARRGHEVVGIDLVEPPEIPQGCTFIKANILNLRYSDDFRENRWFLVVDQERQFIGDFDFICASSSCEQFSVHGMKHFHPNPPYPTLGIELFNYTRALCEASGVPYVMENVRAAQQFVGCAAHHCGPFYLWGNGVPVLVNQGIVKGYSMSREANNLRGRKGHSKADIAALNATIPPELASCVADYAERLCEVPA